MRIFILFLTIFFSCSQKQSNEHLSIFKYNESSGIHTLDPAFSKDQARNWVSGQLFNGLVQLDDNLIPKPSIAKKWDISDDGLDYTFYLRKQVFLHDHELFLDQKREVEAADFCYSFSRLLDHNVSSPGRWVMLNVDTFYAVTDTTLIISLKKPFPAFLGLLSMPYCSVVPKEVVENTDFSKHPIGTGPFHFQFWEKGVKLVLRKNPFYFETNNGEKLPHLDAISVSFIRDKQAAFLEFLQGNLDFISGIDASYKDELLTKDGVLKSKYKDRINLQTEPYLNTEYLGFLMKNPDSPLENILIRKAINYGFDRVKMIKYLRNNIGTPALQGFIPRKMPGFNPDLKGYLYNPDLSRELLSQAGYKNGEGLEIITLSTTSSYLDLCEFIQNQLSLVGIQISIDVNPPATHRNMVANSRLSFFRGSWIADYADAENYLSLFYSKNSSPEGSNYTHFNSSLFDSIYIASFSEKNDSLRFLMYQDLDKIIIDNSPIVPLYYDQVLRFVHKNVKSLNANPMNSLVLKNVKKIPAN